MTKRKYEETYSELCAVSGELGMCEGLLSVFVYHAEDKKRPTARMIRVAKEALAKMRQRREQKWSAK